MREPWFASSRRGFVSRVRWALMPWWAFAWRYRSDFDDEAPVSSTWWRACIGSTTWWLDKLLERLPGGALFEPPRPVVCNCDYCRGVPGAVFHP